MVPVREGEQRRNRVSGNWDGVEVTVGGSRAKVKGSAVKSLESCTNVLLTQFYLSSWFLGSQPTGRLSP